MVKKRREKIKRKLDARDLRHVMGIGIAVTRGAASSLSFCYSLLLLTVSRNLITKMKEWAFNQYIPLDSNIIFHKIVACTALFFSVLHSITTSCPKNCIPAIREFHGPLWLPKCCPRIC